MRVSVGLETTHAEVEALERVFRWAEIPVLVDDGATHRVRVVLG